MKNVDKLFLDKAFAAILNFPGIWVAVNQSCSYLKAKKTNSLIRCIR